MPYDIKKDLTRFYTAKPAPEVVDIGEANYLSVSGQGNPNDEFGAYSRAVGALYAVGYTLKMSEKAGYHMDGFFDYVVPPLEGLWRQDGVETVDYTDKSTFRWVSLLRLPDFVTPMDVAWAKEAASRKKKEDYSSVAFLTLREGLCVQMLHIGAFDDEPATVRKMDAYLAENGYRNDINDDRMHHEIYLSDPRKSAVEKRRTIIRHPIARA